MQIQKIVSITELSRLLNKSRPTVYKYIADYESGLVEEVPLVIKTLFDKMVNGEYAKKDIYEYCYNMLYVEQEEEIKEIVDLIKENKKILNLTKIKEFIQKEIKR